MPRLYVGMHCLLYVFVYQYIWYIRSCNNARKCTLHDACLISLQFALHTFTLSVSWDRLYTFKTNITCYRSCISNHARMLRTARTPHALGCIRLYFAYSPPTILNTRPTSPSSYRSICSRASFALHARSLAPSTAPRPPGPALAVPSDHTVWSCHQQPATFLLSCHSIEYSTRSSGSVGRQISPLSHHCSVRTYWSSKRTNVGRGHMPLYLTRMTCYYQSKIPIPSEQIE